MAQPSVVPLISGGTVAVIIYSLGHISGAHINPAVTIAFWVIGKFPARRILGYIAAQLLGSLAAAGVHLLLWGSGHNFGATLLSSSLGVGVTMEIILSFLLMFVVAAIATDARAEGGMIGLAVGMVVALGIYVGGPVSGAAMNPARSFGPALLSGQFQDLWVYLIFTVVGAVLGALCYENIRCRATANARN